MRRLRKLLILLLATGAGCILSSSTALAQQRGGGGGGGGARGGGGGNVIGGAAIGAGGARAAGSTTGQSGPTAVGGATIQYDDQTNSVIVITDEKTKDKIKSVIESLDRTQPQALIKVLFLEVTHTLDTDLGVDWSTPISPKTTTTVAANGTTAQTTTNKGTVSTNFGVTGATDGTIVKLAYTDLTATLRALAKTSKLNVLSRPSIMARNNQVANITVGQQVPRITSSIVTTAGETVSQVAYDNIGIILNVTPFITPDGMVQMDVDPQISTFTGDSVAISNTATAPVYAVRSASTSVVVPSGMTVIIGGMMSDQNTNQIQKVPVLGDIPFVGALFSRTVVNKSKTELLIFLTPTVVDTAASLQDLTANETAHSSMVPQDISHSTMQRFEVTK